MGKRKVSTFERLQCGKLKRKDYKELQRRLQAEDPGLTVVHGNAAGVDVGSRSHFAAVPPGRAEQPIREFGSWTAGLQEMAAWLISCQIDTVAVQATGVYWLGLCDVLEQAGLKVCLVNAHGTKNLPGRKTDVQECEWLRKLHTYGLLRDSYRPPEAIREIRDLWRLRERWVQDTGRALQQMQKSLTAMNLHLSNTVSDIGGVTGMAIIRAIVAGQRDSRELAKLRDPRVRASEEEIAHSLEGTWREAQLFELEQVVEHYDFLGKKIAELDERLQQRMQAMPTREPVVSAEATTKASEGPTAEPGWRKAKRKKPSKNAPKFDLGKELERVLGVDLTVIDGVHVLIAQTVYAEVGPDLSAFPTEGHFTAWLGLAPMRSISGGRLIRHERKKVKNRLSLALRMGAETLENSQSYLGARFRHLKGRLGPAKAVKAMARYLACQIYRLMRKGQAWIDRGEAVYEAQRSARELQSLKRKAKALGMQVVPTPA
jgi:transposase